MEIWWGKKEIDISARISEKPENVFKNKVFADELISIWGYVHTYTISKRIRYRKDPFWVCPHVSYVNPATPFTRTWIDPRKLMLPHLKTTASVHCLQCCSVLKETCLPRAQISIFFVSFACQCCSSVLLHVLQCARRKSVRSLRIMEAGDKERL